MKKLQCKIEGFLRSDEMLHFLMMFFIEILLIQFTSWNIWILVVIPVIIGVGKELFDKLTTDWKTFSLTDLLATILGGGLAILIMI